MRLRLTPSAAFASAASSGVESVEAMHIQYERYSVFDGGRAPFRWPASQSNDRPRLPPDSPAFALLPVSMAWRLLACCVRRDASTAGTR
jgi:hypothetical protein